MLRLAVTLVFKVDLENNRDLNDFTCDELKLKGYKTEDHCSGTRHSLSQVAATWLSSSEREWNSIQRLHQIFGPNPGLLPFHCMISFLYVRLHTSNSGWLLPWDLSWRKTKSATAQLISSFILCWLDCCNSLTDGLPSEELSRKFWPTLQNLSFKIFRCDHTNPLFLKLHWLPMKCKIEYEIATFAFRHFSNTIPP